MTRSNRILNRVLLALVGLALVGAGIWIAGRTAEVRDAIGWSSPDIPAPAAIVGWATVGALALVAVLALAWALTRGRGSIDDLHDEAGVRISHDVAGDVLRDELAGQPDLASLSTRAYRMRGRRTLLVRVATVAGADLPRLLTAVRGAVAELDRQLERPVPVALHLTPGSRVTARVRRVD